MIFLIQKKSYSNNNLIKNFFEKKNTQKKQTKKQKKRKKIHKHFFQKLIDVRDLGVIPHKWFLHELMHAIGKEV